MVTWIAEIRKSEILLFMSDTGVLRGCMKGLLPYEKFHVKAFFAGKKKGKPGAFHLQITEQHSAKRRKTHQNKSALKCTKAFSYQSCIVRFYSIPAPRFYPDPTEPFKKTDTCINRNRRQLPCH
ncbi:hypothetical protein CEXT_15631 [Caerostris extrusa]|uniref:Uncharacterized protein n=1 Tax=Caerostris extrusa TaxID=172846 RepID=A0AAV4MBU2_CAEEX|nr:hypothetical protein CEXT_15631 [Caerostris extrusa]